MPGSEDFEKLVRHCKKVANLDAERERADRRFRAIDALKDFIRKNENHEWFKESLSDRFFEVGDILGRGLAEFGRKFTSEIIEIICDMIFIVIEHRGEETPFQWLKSRFELLDTSNRKHRNVLQKSMAFDQIKNAYRYNERTYKGII